ncbi:MAG: sugar ABC transporter ATP-binding protein [Anaerolineae bacterium]
MSDYMLEMNGISKMFFGVYALRDITLKLKRGHVLGLIGQNGAGKSTLMNILGGVVKPDTGTMRYADAPYTPDKPSDATRKGIAFIHQELNLFTNLTIAENIYLDNFPQMNLGPFRMINRRSLREQTRSLLQSMGLALQPDTPLDELSPGERQLVEISKALAIDADLIIFDEPTTSLTARETEQLFNIIAGLREAGKTVIYISHILEDVQRLADDIAVLRDGMLIEYGPAHTFDITRMISLMIGRQLEQLFPTKTNQPSAEVALAVDGVSMSGIVKDIHLKVHKGEILGLFGLMGSGRTELARIIFGLDPFEEGTITINAKALDKATAQARIQNGVAFVTENRRDEGLMMDATIADNLSIVALDAFVQGPLAVVNDARRRSASHDVVNQLQVKSGDIERTQARSLSGGNQQKVVIGKWLLSRPTVFLMDEPTRGVDVGAKYEIYNLMNNLAGEGSGVLFISSELQELMGMCDRILVMAQGEICGEFTRRPFDEEDILRAAFREGNGATL